MRTYSVYILASKSRRLYIGVTGNLLKRLALHREGYSAKSFTTRYRITRLVYVEYTGDVNAAILREKQLKGWARARKLELISHANPTWDDLMPDWR